MSNRGLGFVGIGLFALSLTGCIPHDGDRARSRNSDAPYLQTDMTTVAQEPSSWEAHPAAGEVIEVPGGTYTVQQGDTLRAVGIKTGVGWETLVRVNHLTPPYTLAPGTQLTVPAGRYHIVRAGESGIAIAKAHGVHWAEIVALNGLSEPYIIHTDQRLLLPPGEATHNPSVLGSESAAPRTPESDAAIAARAAAFNLDDVVQGGAEPAQDANIRRQNKHDRQAPGHTLSSTAPVSGAVSEPSHFSGGTFSWPLNGSVVTRFGGTSRGIDISAPAGSLVAASANGTVAFVGPIAGYGGTVILRHGDGWLTIYSHITKVSVVRGGQVRRGQVIGIMGSEGSSKAVLHFEIRSHKTPIDPLKKLA